MNIEINKGDRIKKSIKKYNIKKFFKDFKLESIKIKHVEIKVKKIAKCEGSEVINIGLTKPYHEISLSILV